MTTLPAGGVLPSVLRTRFISALAAGLGSSWRESVFTPAAIGADGGPVPSHVFSVELPDLQIEPGRRRSVTQGADFEPWLATTTVVIRWLWRLRADGASADYATAIDIEPTIFGILFGGDNFDHTGIQSAVVSGSRRDVIADGNFLLGTLTLTLRHPYAIVVPD